MDRGECFVGKIHVHRATVKKFRILLDATDSFSITLKSYSVILNFKKPSLFYSQYGN